MRHEACILQCLHSTRQIRRTIKDPAARHRCADMLRLCYALKQYRQLLPQLQVSRRSIHCIAPYGRHAIPSPKSRKLQCIIVDPTAGAQQRYSLAALERTGCDRQKAECCPALNHRHAAHTKWAWGRVWYIVLCKPTSGFSCSRRYQGKQPQNPVDTITLQTKRCLLLQEDMKQQKMITNISTDTTCSPK